MKQCVVVLLFLTVLAVATAQMRLANVKQGVCPPPIASQTCTQTCRGDGECLGQEKCCRTSCNGYICVPSVTATGGRKTDKPGRCPVKPTGAWVCSNTCSFDSDCRGRMKCCRGRCPGSMICQKAEL